MEALLSTKVTRRVFSVMGSSLLACLWLLFAYRHLARYAETREVALVLLCLSETVQAALFVFRRDAVAISERGADWVIAVCGTFAPLLLLPTAESSSAAVGSVLVVCGIVLQILGLISLNRSFGIVPAKRVVMTRGMYRFIRHPMYASYFVLFGGYVLGHPSAWNVLVIAFTFCCLVARMHREERLLSGDIEYLGYMSRVRYRVLPFVY